MSDMNDHVEQDAPVGLAVGHTPPMVEAPARAPDAITAAAFDQGHAIAALGSVPVDVQVVLGSTRIPIGNVLKLGRGAVVEIDRKVGEAVDIHINHRLVARGEIVIVDDDRLGVTLTEILNIEPGLN